jgi:copper chaperone
MQTIRLNIDGMHCGACVRRVKAALANVPGATVVAVEIGHAEVAVEEGATDTLPSLEAAVRAAGFAPAAG